MAVPVRRYQRPKTVGDPNSPLYYYLRQEPGSFQIVTLRMIAQRMERSGSLTAQDTLHSFENFILEIRNELVLGNKVKIPGLGTFQMTFSTEGTETEEECTVKKIKKVNIRFLVDNTLRLVNDSNATTRGAVNNVQFYIKKKEKTNAEDNGGNNNSGGDDGGGGGGDEFIDPSA